MTDKQFSALYELLSALTKDLLDGADIRQIREEVKKLAHELGLKVEPEVIYTQAGQLEID